MNASQSPNLSDPLFLGRPTTWRALDELSDVWLPDENTTLHGSGSGSAKFLLDLNTMLWRVVPPLFVFFGTLGNVMTLVVMRGMRRSPSTACLALYFNALAVSDQIQLLHGVLFFWLDMGYGWPLSFYRFELLCSVPKCLWNVTKITSAYFLVAMTYQRVTSVVAPHRVGVVCTVRRGKIIVAAIVFFGVALNFHFLFTWIYRAEHGQCYFDKKYVYLIDYFEWQELVIFSMLPFLFLLVGNLVLIRHAMKAVQISHRMKASADQQTASRKEKVHSMSMTLIVTSTAYVLFTLPSCIFDVYMKEKTVAFSDDLFEWAVVSLVRTLELFFWFCSMSLNFYLYLLSGSRFRQEAKRYLCCRDTDHAKRASSQR